MVIDYAAPTKLTDLRSVHRAMLANVEQDPVELCRPVASLIVQPSDVRASGISLDRLSEKDIRRASEIVARLREMDPAPLTVPREPDKRVVGTCRHFAVLACSILRRCAIPARVRCGFATYFVPNRAVDHWIVEYLVDDRWIRIDPEILGGSVLDRPDDLRPGEFLSGAEAWLAYRNNRVDAMEFGVYGTENWGPAEIRGNLVKDLAALNRVEMLPWDEWGRMTEAYDGRTGPDYDALLDQVAAVCSGDDLSQISTVYGHPDLTVPDELIV
ncbi:hypothetical protein TTY48_36600 [Tsukamurella sp. TY48]|nr:hypothetical protein TTY48_36600 [Tsukamurella sp. TY48]